MLVSSFQSSIAKDLPTRMEKALADVMDFVRNPPANPRPDIWFAAMTLLGRVNRLAGLAGLPDALSTNTFTVDGGNPLTQQIYSSMLLMPPPTSDDKATLFLKYHVISLAHRYPDGQVGPIGPPTTTHTLAKPEECAGAFAAWSRFLKDAAPMPPEPAITVNTKKARIMRRRRWMVGRIMELLKLGKTPSEVVATLAAESEGEGHEPVGERTIKADLAWIKANPGRLSAPAGAISAK